MATKIKIFDSLFHRYINAKVDEHNYLNENGEVLLRIETKGRTGKSLYRNGFYIMGGNEMRVQGMGGSTGFGWGGRIIGYATLEEIKSYKTKIH